MKRLVLVGVFLGLLLGVFVLSDWMFAASLLPSWMWGVLGVGMGVGVIGSHATASRPRFLLLALFALLVGVLPRVEWDSRKSFLRDLYSLRPGMERSQVEALMGGYLRGTGWPAPPVPGSTSLTDVSSGRSYALRAGSTGQLELEDTLVFRHTEEAWGNADWGLVRMRAGRVVSVSFSPD